MSHNQIVTESDIRCNIISLVEKKETALRHARYHAPLHLAPLSGHYDQRAKASPHSSVRSFPRNAVLLRTNAGPKEIQTRGS